MPNPSYSEGNANRDALAISACTSGSGITRELYTIAAGVLELGAKR